MTGRIPAGPLSLCGGHPALDFVNTLDNRFRDAGRSESLLSYTDLLRFMQQTKLLNAAPARRLASSVKPGTGQRVLRSALELREAAATVFYGGTDDYAPLPAVLETLRRVFLDASCHRELQWNQSARKPHPRPGLAWVWGRFEADPALPVWILSQATYELLTSAAVNRVRACQNETCRWLFLDTSKNHSRRWCDMKVCGNRMKARRFQARREE